MFILWGLAPLTKNEWKGADYEHGKISENVELYKQQITGDSILCAIYVNLELGDDNGTPEVGS